MLKYTHVPWRARIAWGLCLAFGLLLAASPGAGAQSGLEQSKSSSTSAEHLFDAVPDELYQQLESNGIDADGVATSDLLGVYPATILGTDEQGGADGYRGPFPVVYGHKGEGEWFRSDVVLMWFDEDYGVIGPWTPNVYPGVTEVWDECAIEVIPANAFQYNVCGLRDSAGVRRQGSFRVYTDSIPPQVTVSGVTSGSQYPVGKVPDAYCATDEVESTGEGLSGVAREATLTTTATAPDQLGEITVTCAGAVDKAGNPSPPVRVTYTVIDPAPPTVDAVIDGTLGDDGWYTSDVELIWRITGTDVTTDGCVAQTLTVDATATHRCVVTDYLGRSASVDQVIKRDSTAPGVTVTGAVDGDTYTLGSVPTVGCVTASEADGQSGVATPATLQVSGGPVGTVVATCAGAVDGAGNETAPVSVSFDVHYPFAGFFDPVDPDALNVVKAGRTVPMKFSLSGDHGLGVLATGSPSSRPVACATGLAQEEVAEISTSSGSGLAYDASQDTYVYTWSTSRSWSGTCREFTLVLDDGSRHTVMFSLR